MQEYFYNHKNLGVCLTFPGLLWLGYSEQYLKVASHRNSNSWPFVKHPEDARKNLLPYESCTASRKSEITGKLAARMGCTHKDEPCKCGDIMQYTAIAPIRDMIIKDLKAEAYYLAHPANLDTVSVKHYTNGASLMNFVLTAADNTREVVKDRLGFKQVADFWEKVIEIVQAEKAAGKLNKKFPASYIRLVSHKESLLKRYREQKYEALVHGLNGKSNAAKVNDEVAEAHLLSLIEDGRQMDDVLVCMIYNTWAEKEGYKKISPATVGVWRKAKEPEITASRYGTSALNDKFIRQVKGRRPSAPLYLVEHDDNNLDFLFADGKYQFADYVSYVVNDSYNDLVLGMSYKAGGSVEQWMVLQAYVDAMYYIRSLTGGWYLPFEIKADKWASTSLKPFYDKVAKMVAPAFKNKHRGYQEQSFGSTHWKRCQQLVSQGNWDGNNITAKYRGVNPDLLEQSLKDKSRPQIGHEAESQIQHFLHLLRHLSAFTRNNMNAPSKEQQWLEAFNRLPDEEKRPIDDMQFLFTFGVAHQPKHTDTIKITNRGCEPQIKGVKYSYDLPNSDDYRRFAGAKVQVIYDPYDMSRVLLTNHKDIRIIATEATLMPRALHDGHTNSRTYLNALIEEKSDYVKDLMKRQEKRQQLVANGYNAEALLKGGAMVKEIKSVAERQVKNGTLPGWEDDSRPTDLMDMINRM